MNSLVRPQCYRCGLPVDSPAVGYCPRCAYPLDPLKEEQFLREFVQNLEQAALYGGEYLPVVTLIARYQRRLYDLAMARTQPAVPPPVPSVVPVQQARPMSSGPIITPPPPVPPAMAATSRQPVMAEPRQAQPVPPPQAPPRPPVKRERMFSIKAFFADQTINIVASLGAFLILAGSLNFAFTTNDHLFSFYSTNREPSLFISIAGQLERGWLSRASRGFRRGSGVRSARHVLLFPA